MRHLLQGFSVILTLVLCGLSQVSLSQTTGSIGGKILDKKTGEELIGVSVQIEGTVTGAITDYEGKYLIGNLKPGFYNLMITYVSYNKKVIKGIEVKQKENTSMNVSMEESTKDLNEVVITAEVKRETAVGLLIQQKNAMSVSDGISADAIRKTPDRNTSDVLKRVSGASIQENRFAIIRGLNERYTTAYINGAPLPSSESDRKAFSFDIFPSSLLDNLVITKTATPDMPGEFGGGIIEINTKSIPDNNFQNISVTGGYNTITTFKNQLTYQGGKTDWLGIDDGTRALPAGIPADKDFTSDITQQREIAKLMKNDWALENKKFSPNYGFQYTFGHTWGEGKSKLGTLFALTYNRTNSFTTTQRKQYDENVGMTEDYLDKNYSTQTLSGLLANLSYKINDNHIITYKNLYSISADDRVIERTGTPTPLDPDPITIMSNAQWFTSNKIYSGQLAGTHYVTAAKIKMNWIGAYSTVNREIPDLRRNLYAKNGEADPVFRANVGSNIGPDYSGDKFYSSTQEQIYSMKVDGSHAFDVKPLHLKNMFKTGLFYQFRNRDFSARQVGFIRGAGAGSSTPFNDSLLALPQNQIFAPQNMGILPDGTMGFALKNSNKPSDIYAAQSKLAAAFMMFDSRFSQHYRLIWGVRAEKFEQIFSTVRDTKIPYDTVTTKIDVLPSANLIISINENQNLRASYSQTVNRPEFRELAPFAFYDYSTRFTVSGNDSLTRAMIYNYDLRYEWYPGKGQILSASGFYKRFDNPIEQVMRSDVTNEISYKNAGSAKNYGVELEFKSLIGSIFNRSEKSFLNNLTVYANLTLVKSLVEIKDIDVARGATKSRPLQGQSPYIINSGIQYFDFESGWSLSLAYNKVGQRIAIVGTADEMDIWENGRDMFDFQIAKSMLKNKLDIRLNIKDVLAQKQYFYQDVNQNGKLDISTDNLVWVTSYGQTLSMSVTYKF